MKKKISAFTLTELLVVLVIIGILVLIALPKLTKQVTSAKEVEAKTALGHIYRLERTYFHEKSKYTTDLEELLYEQDKTISEGGSANYRIEVQSAGPNTFKATATSEVDFDQDGVFNVWSINEQKQLTRDVPD